MTPAERTVVPRRMVVFDWDGTVVDSTAAIVQAIQRAAADLALPVPDAARAGWVIGLGLQAALQHAVPQLTRTDVPRFIERYRVHFTAHDKRGMPFDGIEALLADLAGHCALAVATGKSRAGLNRSFEETGFARYFDASRCADEGEPKPHPWMLLDLCDELGVAPRDTLMIGDTEHDLRMAQAAATDAIVVSYGAHTRSALMAAGAPLCVDQVGELREQVFGWIQSKKASR